MKKSKLEWNPVVPRPDVAGHFMVWSHDQGIRHISTHPDWWNGQDPYNLGKIEMYAYLGPHEIAQQLRDLKKKRRSKKRATARR